MRLMPRSLAGRLTLLLVLALAIAQGIAVFLFAGERIEAVRHAHRDNVMVRAGTVARLLADTPTALHGPIVSAASTDFVRFSLTDEPLVVEAGAGTRAAAIAHDLAVALDVGRERVRVAPPWSRHRHDHDRDDHRRIDGRDDDDEDDHHHGPGRWRRHWFTASVAMHDGRWLNVAVGPPPGAPPWGRTFLLAFVLSALGVAVVTVLMGRRISKPMQRLATAADRLGRGEEVGDLPEAGPLEMRSTVRAFNLMRERLDRFVRDRTAMLAAISHDLRTPITSLRLHAELLEDERTKAKIVAALDEMQRMTEETLAFIREDMRREETRTVDLHALIDSVAADLAELGHEITVPEFTESAESGRVLVACRPVALRRAFRNLLENAAAYGVRAAARITRDDAGLRVVIEDEGPGIPEGDLERVFEPFVRLEESRSRDTAGTGLGLAIARTIVRGHGGDIRLENRETGGLRATVALPGVDGA